MIVEKEETGEGVTTLLRARYSVCEEWLRLSGLAIEPEKTELMFFQKPYERNAVPPPYWVDLTKWGGGVHRATGGNPEVPQVLLPPSPEMGTTCEHHVQLGEGVHQGTLDPGEHHSGTLHGKLAAGHERRLFTRPLLWLPTMTVQNEMVKVVMGSFRTALREPLLVFTRMLPMSVYLEKLMHTSALQLYRLPRASQLLQHLGPEWYVPGRGDFREVVPGSSVVPGRRNRAPTALEALAMRVPSDGPRVDPVAIPPWEVPNWAGQVTHIGVGDPGGRKDWMHALQRDAPTQNSLIIHVQAKVSSHGRGDGKEPSPPTHLLVLILFVSPRSISLSLHYLVVVPCLVVFPSLPPSSDALRSPTAYPCRVNLVSNCDADGLKSTIPLSSTLPPSFPQPLSFFLLCDCPFDFREEFYRLVLSPCQSSPTSCDRLRAFSKSPSTFPSYDLPPPYPSPYFVGLRATASHFPKLLVFTILNFPLPSSSFFDFAPLRSYARSPVSFALPLPFPSRPNPAAAATFSVGGADPTHRVWVLGEGALQFDADAFGLAKTAEYLAMTYLDEVPPPGAARWREYRGETGYFVDFASGPTRFRPVEFNFDNLCWVEITWNPIENRYNAVRPAGRNYNCDIDARNLPTREEWGRIDGQPEEEPSTSEPRTPAPSETSEDNEETDNDEESEVGEIIQTAESLRINEPENIEVHPPADMATATITQEDLTLEEARRITEEAESYLRPINPTTGHRMTADDAAIFRAVGPDVPDPPPGAGGPPAPRRPGGPFGQGPPRGGRPPHGGRQPQFGGGGGGDPFGGGPPPPPPPAAGPAPGAPHGSDKLVGETPTIFDGNRDEYESFLTQWHIYWGQNSEAPIMTNVYRRCLLFLGFIKGPRVSNWTLGFLQWLNNELHQGRSRYNPFLWDTLTAGFSDRFLNVLEQEQAQATLAKGFKMIGDDIDSYVTNFEQLARKADYRLNDHQTLDRFTAGLPRALFTKIYELDDPQTFNEWKEAALRRQKQYIHLRARLGLNATPRNTPPPRPQPNRGYAPQWAPPRFPPPCYDPNAMDTSADRTRARLAEVGDPNRGSHQKPPFPPRGGPGQNRGGGPRRDMREVICYNCNNPGHFSRECTRPRKPRQPLPPRASTSRSMDTDYYSQEPTTVCRAEATPEEQAKGWMEMLRGASDEVKDLIFKDLWTQEGFQDA
ncbi:hypothetical protein EDB92DRAFT_2119081 [Lactarius akahatsu]|uniref:CCHC-type domain-containing protein n=1 Tax=Lactarius akahatsu TaxID=416441 RepID=A0AAD4Q7K5_9AGAM|nr:hypothetical protein EDB92DRAFT_2119081 [Lactarius akahatsu]